MRYLPERYLFKKRSDIRHKDGVQFGVGLRQGRLLSKTGSVKTGGGGSNQAVRVRAVFHPGTVGFRHVMLPSYRMAMRSQLDSPDIRRLL